MAIGMKYCILGMITVLLANIVFCAKMSSMDRNCGLFSTECRWDMCVDVFSLYEDDSVQLQPCVDGLPCECFDNGVAFCSSSFSKLPETISKVRFRAGFSTPPCSPLVDAAANVTHLSLNGCHITEDDVTSDTLFKSIENLTCLIVRDMQSRKHRMFPVDWTSDNVLFPLSVLTNPAVKTLQLGNDFLRQYYEFMNEVLPMTDLQPSIETFYACEHISYQSDGVLRHLRNHFNLTMFCNFHKLQNLTLSHCGMFSVSVSCPLFVKKLDLSWNKIRDFPEFCHNVSTQSESLFPELEHLVLHSNLLFGASENNMVSCLPRLKELDLRNTMFFHFLFFRSPRFLENVFSTVRVLRLDDQDHNYRSEPRTIGDEVAFPKLLNYLSVTDSGLDFSDQGFFTSKTFTQCPDLQVLVLDENDFTRVDERRFLVLFGRLRQLRVMSMVKCGLAVILQDWSHFPELTHLRLAGNRIHFIADGAFASLLNLDFLDISGNYIQTISKMNFPENVLQTISFFFLENNSLVCSCDILWLREWMIIRPSVFRLNMSNANIQSSYDCKNIFGRSILDFDINIQQCLLSTNASVWITVVCSMFLCVFIFINIVSRYRWYIRLAFYDLFRGRTNYNLQRLEETHFQFDVFVSYASEDFSWVRNHIMYELEDRLRLRLCIHERDFIPGHNIVDNIADCVESSKKILMVFSRDFVRSQWCQFKLTFCLSHVMEHDDVMVIVCVDDVASREVTPAMMALMNTTTYIQWQPNADTSFRERLRLSLRDILHNAWQPEHIV